jgi:hypothetical protein
MRKHHEKIRPPAMMSTLPIASGCPTVAIAVAQALRVQSGHLPADHPARGHLEWMVESSAGQADWPSDKRWRWLGYVAGALVGRGATRLEDQYQWLEHVARGETLANPDHEMAVRQAVSEVMEGLRAPATAHAHLAEWVNRLDTSAVAVQQSFWLGALQAQLEALGVISVAGERERTRPIFHRCYAHCGWPVPASLGPTAS